MSLASGPLTITKSYTACIVNGVRFVVHSRDSRRRTQNSAVSTPGDDGCMYYGLLEDIVELIYICEFKVVLFKCKWFKTDNSGTTIRCIKKNNITSILTSHEWFKNDQHILATQAKQIFYLDDPSKTQHWKVVQEVNHRKLWDRDIIVENEVDVIHGTSSSDTTLDANLESLTYSSLGILEQPTSVQIGPTRTNDSDFIDDEDDDDEDDDDEDGDDEDGDECEPQLPANETYSSDEHD